MTEIIIRLCKPSSSGRLYYRRDPELEPDILLVQNPQRRQMAYCINVEGGRLLLYFDAHRMLQDVEFGGRRKYWQKTSLINEPQSSEESDIILTGVQPVPGNWKRPYIRRRPDGSTIRHFEYDLDVVATTDAGFSYVHIALGASDESSRWVTLSEQCWAQIAGDRLKGFFVKFTDTLLFS